jgi:hypothetical protein
VCINDASIGSLAWSFPERAIESDNVRVTKSIYHQATQYLVCSGFGFALPEASIVTGIIVENEVSVGGVGEVIIDNSQRIVRSGVIGATERLQATPWPQVDTIIGHGSSSDVWGECWCAMPTGTACGNPACGNVNNPDFGAALSAVHMTGNGGTARVDQVRITLHYIPATPTPSPTITLTGTPTWTPTMTITPTPSFASCPSSPADGCAVPGKGRIRIIANTSPVARQLKWSWERGTANLAEFGDPLQGTNYALCLYDDDHLRAELKVPSSAVCGPRNCWQSSSRLGFGYRDHATNSDGVAELRLSAGSGAATIRLKAKRANLSILMPLHQESTLTVQLVKNPGSGSECWATRFAPPAAQSSLDNFTDSLPD